MAGTAAVHHVMTSLWLPIDDGPLVGPRKCQFGDEHRGLGNLMTMTIEAKILPAASKRRCLRVQRAAC